MLGLDIRSRVLDWVLGMGLLGMGVLGMDMLGLGRYVNWLWVWCECVVGLQIGCGRVSYVPVRSPFQPVRISDLLCNT